MRIGRDGNGQTPEQPAAVVMRPSLALLNDVALVRTPCLAEEVLKRGGSIIAVQLAMEIRARLEGQLSDATHKGSFVDSIEPFRWEGEGHVPHEKVKQGLLCLMNIHVVRALMELPCEGANNTIFGESCERVNRLEFL